MTRVMVFDTETTGLPTNKQRPTQDNSEDFPYIVQFSYVIYEINLNKIEKIVDNIICVPDNVEISAKSESIHGISKKMSRENGCDIGICLSEFVDDFYTVDMVVAHNLKFDKDTLFAELFRWEKKNKTNPDFAKKYAGFMTDFDGARLHCTMQETIELCKIAVVRPSDGITYFKYPSLSELHNHLFGVVPKNLHNSLNDVVVCLCCFYKIKFNLNLCEIDAEVNKMMSNLI